MSRTIDEKVVEMRFDNKQFEAGTKETLGTLEKLKQALKFQDVGKSFDTIQRSANRVDMNGLGSAVEGVKLKFSALEVVAISTLSNIANRAVDAGIRLAKSLSLDQVNSGFGEYELKMGSIQTIMASTGESLETVNGYLQELNEYSDKTIYSFSDMTQNIGKFTNAGVKLEDAVKAIQGISNEAAISGANANEASRAMYNFAQALSAGSVRLIDWKSIENANMATVEFKQSLMDTAVAMGTVVKEGDKYRTTTTDLNGKVSELFDSTTMFNDSLAHQWLTTDVLVKTLGNYSTDVRNMTAAEKEAYEEKLRGIGYTEEQIKKIEELGVKAFNSAQDVKTFTQLIDTIKESVGSGWAQTFELIVGDFEEAKQLWTNVNNTLGTIIQASSDSRNELLRQWKAGGGRDALLDGIANSFNAVLSIAKALKMAFRDIFPKMTADRLIDITKGFRDLTARLIPSEKALENLRKTFSGLFSIVDIVGQVIGAFFKILLPGVSTVGDLSGGILEVTASIGDWITNLDKAIKENGWFVEVVEKAQNVVSDAIDNIEDFAYEIGQAFKTLTGIEDINLDNVISNVSNAFKDLTSETGKLSFKSAEEAFASLKNKIQELLDLAMSNEGFSTFVTNAQKFGDELKEVFTLDNLLDRIEKIMEVFGKFFNWVRTVMGPAFKDFNVGSAVAAGGGIGLIYAMIKAAKSLENLTGALKSIPDLLGGVSDTLVAYQKDLKASAIIKIAGAIAILAGALVLLSFADTGRLMKASIALAIVGGTLMFGISKLLDAVNKGKEVNSALNTFASGLSSTMKKFGRALEIRAIGTAVKKFAESIAIIAVSIIALGITYRKDKEALLAGADAIATISMVLVAVMAVGTLAGQFAGSGMKNLSGLLKSVASLATGLFIVVMALDKLFKITLPSDYETKLGILAGMFVGLAAIALIVGIAGRIAGGGSATSLAGARGPFGTLLKGVRTQSNGGAITAGPILALTAMLYTTVSALNKLFKMQLPTDWQDKVTILGLVFVGLAGLMIVMAGASRLAGGSIKAAGTILSMSFFIGSIVAALMVLSIIPGQKLLKGTLALGTVLTALGIALYGAGKISDKDAYKSVLAMTLAVGVIAASLAFLSMVPFSKLLKSAVALGSILVILAENFKQVSKITNKKAWLSILTMIGAVVTISASLYVLAKQPWERLLSAAVSLSAVLLAFGQAFKIISSTGNLKVDKIGLFLLATTSLIPIGVALYALSTQPWANMLASGAALTGTLLALSSAFSVISASSPNLMAIGTFVLAAASVGIIAYSLYELAKHPWENMLTAAASLSLVLLAMSGAMAICTSVGAVAGAALAGIGLLDLFLANFVAVLAVLGAIYQSEGARTLMSGGAEALVLIGKAIGDFVGAIVEGVLTGIAASLPAIGEGLSGFMSKLGGFIEGSKSIDDSVLKGVGILAACIIAITAAEVIAGIGTFLGGAVGMISVATNLVLFIETLEPFLDAVEGIDAESMEAVKNLAEMIIILTAADMLNGIGQFLGISGSISEFATELVKFGPSIKTFADTVKDVKPEAVQGAAAAAEIMANMANKLPATGGLVQKLFGKRSLAEFGMELVKFGPSIKMFSIIVKDVKQEAVQGAAAAAEIMANMATKLPAQGGLVQKLFGKKSLSEFGTELVKFGPKIAIFSAMASTVKADSITGVQSITTIMTNLANNLPDSETLWNKIFGGGNVTLSEFGNQLVSFGGSMSDFASSVSTINVSQVNGAITSFKNLVDLATYVQGKSATDLINFSNQLSQIGSDSVNNFIQSFTNAAPNVKTAIYSLCATVITSLNANSSAIKDNAIAIGNDLCDGIQNGIVLKQLSLVTTVIKLATSIKTSLQNSMTVNNFNPFGQNIVQGLINGINSKKPLALSTVGNLCTAIVNKFRTSFPSTTFSTIGSNIVQGLINGINSKKPLALSTVGNLCTAIVNKFRTDLSSETFKKFGENIVVWISQGMDSKKSTVDSSATQICSSITKAFEGNFTESKFREIGANAALGLKYGIESKIDEIADAAVKAARTAINSAKEELDEHSPSKVAWEIGEFFSIGLASGISNKIKEIGLSGTEAADEAIDPIRKAVNKISEIIGSDDFDLNPVISPVVDLSDVQRKARDISSLMNQTYDISSVYDRVMDTSSSFTVANKPKSNNDDVNSKSGEGSKYEFNQYNYSPKALSRSEIYRQTNNQFSAFRKAVNPV